MIDIINSINLRGGIDIYILFFFETPGTKHIKTFLNFDLHFLENTFLLKVHTLQILYW